MTYPTLAAFLVVASTSAVAFAQPTDADVARRLAFIETRLAATERSGDLWWSTWFAAYTALTVGQAAIACAVTDPGLRADMAVGAVTSSLGVVPLGLFPLRSGRAAALARIDAANPAERRAKLAIAERLLRERAEQEAFGRSWESHALGVVVSVASGAVLAFAYDRVASGIVNAVGGVAVSELQIWTQPVGARDSLAASPSLATDGRGLAVVLPF